jgi:hypothetical protein
LILTEAGEPRKWLEGVSPETTSSSNTLTQRT